MNFANTRLIGILNTLNSMKGNNCDYLRHLVPQQLHTWMSEQNEKEKQIEDRIQMLESKVFRNNDFPRHKKTPVTQIESDR